MFVLAPNQNQNQNSNQNQNQNQSNSPSMMPCYVPCFFMPHPGAPGNPMMQPPQQPNMGDYQNALGGNAMGGMAMYPPQGNAHGFVPVPVPYPMPPQGQDGDGQGRANEMNPSMPGPVFLANGPHGHPSPVGMIMPMPMQPGMDQQPKNDYPNPRMKHMQVPLPRPANHDGDDTKRTAVRLRGLPYDASAHDVVQFFKGLSIDENSVVFMPNKRKSSAAPGAPVKRGWGEAWAFFPDEAQAAAAMERRGQHVGSRWIELKLFTIADSETEIWRAYANSGAFDHPASNNDAHNPIHTMRENNYMPTAPAPFPGWEFNGARGNGNGGAGGSSPLQFRKNTQHSPQHASPNHQALHPLPLNTVAFGGGNVGQSKGRMGAGNTNKRHANISVVPQNPQNIGSLKNDQSNQGRGVVRGNGGGNATPPPHIQTQSQPQQQPSPPSPQPQSPIPSYGLLGSPLIGSPQTAMQPQIHSPSTPLALGTLRGSRVVLLDEDGLVVPSTPATAPATAPAAVLHSTDPDVGFASLIAHDFNGKQPEWVQQWRNAKSSESGDTQTST